MRAFNFIFISLTVLAFVFLGLFGWFGAQADWTRLAPEASDQTEAQATAAAPTAPTLSAAGEAGKALFNANCAACHKPVGQLVGPQLAGVASKYADDPEWLYKWVKNSQGLIKANDPRAVALFEEYNKQVMTAFPTLSNEEIDQILTYADEMGG